ncbi:hypothetical protein D3C71_1038400 [compost metagenome]
MLIQHLAHFLIPAKVQQIVAGQASNQKLHRDVVHMTLVFDRLRRWLSAEQFGQRTAHGLPPLMRRHVLCCKQTKTLPLTRQGSLKLSFVEGRL